MTSGKAPKGARLKLATVWLDGCSGCHTSLLDMDERLLEITQRAELVYGPLVDTKDFPEGVDITLVEGAVGTTEDLRRIREVRERTRVLVALGDCAITSNVPGMRSAFGKDAVLLPVYLEKAALNQQVPSQGVPELLEECLPVHAWVPVDVYLTGCPPSAERIYAAIKALLDGKPVEEISRFG
jgi:NAD-reducing hydrogenase small subunit